MKTKKKIKYTARTKIIFLILLFLVLYSIIYIVPKVSDIFTPTYSAQYGTLEDSFSTDCVVVRDEKAFKAQNSGSVSRKAEVGDLLRKGRTIVTVGGREHNTDMKGLVSYHYDGYESKLTPDSIPDLTKSFLSSFKEAGGEVKETAKGSVESGDVIYKIIDNKRWYLVCWVNKEKAETINVGSGLQVVFDEETKVPVTVDSVTEQNGSYQVVLSSNHNYKDFDKFRIKECTIITSSNSGIILETKSIVEKGGKKGVYVVDKYGDANFVPISILSTAGDKTVVIKNYFYDSKGNSVATVKSYDIVLKRGE